MRTVITLIIILSVGFVNAQNVIYSNKNLTVVDNLNQTYTFTYGKKYQYTSTVEIQDKEVVNNIVTVADKLLNSKRPGMSQEIVNTVGDYKIIRNRWNLYIEDTSSIGTNLTSSNVHIKKLNGTVKPINKGTLYTPFIYTPRYYPRTYYRYYSRF